MLLPHGTIVALVDGDRFELFRNTGNEAAPELTKQDTPSLDLHNHSAGVRHDSNKGNPSGHHKMEDVHAAAAAEWLNRQVLDHKIENLVIIAAPRTLGEMRDHYHGQLKQALMGEVAKDLIGKQGPDIIAALRGM